MNDKDMTKLIEIIKSTSFRTMFPEFKFLPLLQRLSVECTKSPDFFKDLQDILEWDPYDTDLRDDMSIKITVDFDAYCDVDDAKDKVEAMMKKRGIEEDSDQWLGVLELLDDLMSNDYALQDWYEWSMDDVKDYINHIQYYDKDMALLLEKYKVGYDDFEWVGDRYGYDVSGVSVELYNTLEEPRSMEFDPDERGLDEFVCWVNSFGDRLRDAVTINKHFKGLFKFKMEDEYHYRVDEMLNEEAKLESVYGAY